MDKKQKYLICDTVSCRVIKYEYQICPFNELDDTCINHGVIELGELCLVPDDNGIVTLTDVEEFAK